jgi:hypothetical protein
MSNEIVPRNLSQEVAMLFQQMNVVPYRVTEARQERDYRVDYANGDRMYAHEVTSIRVYEAQ